jgi:hypothetical protein
MVIVTQQKIKMKTKLVHLGSTRTRLMPIVFLGVLLSLGCNATATAAGSDVFSQNKYYVNITLNTR